MIGRIVDWIPRLILAWIFAKSGFSKLMDINTFAHKVSLQVPLAYLVSIAELTGALFIVIGNLGFDLLTRFAGLFFGVITLGAIMLMHWPKLGEMDFPLLILGVSLTYLIRGNH